MKPRCLPTLCTQALVVCLTGLVTLAGCYRDPDPSKIICTTGAHCPNGYECVVQDGVGRCRHSGGDAAADAPLAPPDRRPDATTDSLAFADRLVSLDQVATSDGQLTTEVLTMPDAFVPSDGQPMADTASLPPDSRENPTDSAIDQPSGVTMDATSTPLPDAPPHRDLPQEVPAVDGASADLPDTKMVVDTQPPDAPPVPVCGNNIVEQNEQCDDGNTVTEVCAYGLASCTVCNSSCQSVPGAPATCGDGKLDSAHEACDDGNTITEVCAYGVASCTVCNNACQSVSGATSKCGDGKVEAGREQCDDGNTVLESCPYGEASCTVCNATCESVAGATSYCGDGKTDLSHEQCDDGNAITEFCTYGLSSCVVCNESCQTEPGATSLCGDGQTDPSHEQCDDGNAVTETCAYGLTSCNVCNSACRSAAGTTSYCGDGRLDSTKEDCEGSGSCSAGGYNGNCTACACAPTKDMIYFETSGCDFTTGECGSPSFAGSDFYYGNDGSFYANNLGQQGVVDLGGIPGSLRKIVIPGVGYTTNGVPAVLNHVYVAMASTSEPGHYIVFRVVAFVGQSGVRILWIYV